MRFLAALLLCLIPLSSVAAKPSSYGIAQFNGDRYVRQQIAAPSPPARHATRGRAHKARHYDRTKKTHPAPFYRKPGTVAPLTLAGGFGREWSRAGTVILGGRPAGCPSRFCACGASLYVFGRIIPSLNLAANWLRFPRAAPSSGMVAARRGHVFVLKQHIAGSTWLVHDSNSGGRRTRVHPRSIAGYAIVNPRGA